MPVRLGTIPDRMTFSEEVPGGVTHIVRYEGKGSAWLTAVSFSNPEAAEHISILDNTLEYILGNGVSALPFELVSNPTADQHRIWIERRPLSTCGQ